MSDKALRAPDPVIMQYSPTRKTLSQESPPVDLTSAVAKINNQNPDINGDGVPDHFEMVAEDTGWWINVKYGVRNSIQLGNQTLSIPDAPFSSFEENASLVGYVLRNQPDSVGTRITSIQWERQIMANTFGSLIVITEGRSTLSAMPGWVLSAHTFTFERAPAITTPPKMVQQISRKELP